MKKRVQVIGVILVVILISVVLNFVFKPRILPSPVLPSSAYEFYVSVGGGDSNPGTIEEPFATIEKARDKIRELKQNKGFDNSIKVFLREGTYSLDKTFTLTSEDSGEIGKEITYQAYFGEKVIISGGKKINLNWDNYNDNIYVADVSDFVNGYGEFNSLFVDDKRAIRSRIPNEGNYYLIEAVDGDTQYEAFNFSDGNIDEDWRNLLDIEIVTYRAWEQDRHRINRVEGNKVYIVGKSNRPYSAYNTWSGGRYYIENIFEGLSEGEWYLDKQEKNLYYWPLQEENVNDLEFIVPIVNSLLKVKGKTNSINLSEFSFTISHLIKTISSNSQMYTVGNSFSSNMWAN